MRAEIKQNERPYQVCKNCVMDTTDEDIVFDQNGVCQRCNEYKTRILPDWNHGKGHEAELEKLIRIYSFLCFSIINVTILIF